jgi:hypothetical protein
VIVYLPLVVFLIGLWLAYASAGRRRQVGTLAMVGAVTWSLILLSGPPVISWGIGPLLATLALRPTVERVSSTFEVLTRRTLWIAGLMLLAILLALRLPVGENPLPLNLVPWALGAVGTAWALNPIDTRERLQGQLLMVAATAALILVAAPAGRITAAAAGVAALIPLAGERALATPPARSLLSSLMLLLALVAAAFALTGRTLSPLSAGDLGFSFTGPVLLAVAVVLLGAVLACPIGMEWTGLAAALALTSSAPALRWAAVAALIAVATLTEPDGHRPAWFSLASLAAIPVLQGLGPPASSARIETVALGVGIVMALFAARRGVLRAVELPTIGFLVLIAAGSLNSGNLTRFQWLTAAGGLVLIGRALLAWLRNIRAGRPTLARSLISAMVLVSISARDPLALGALAAVLLLIDIAVIRPAILRSEAGRIGGRLATLARSDWPPSITFAGATLTVVAALQASLVLGLLAALMLAALQLAPLLDHAVTDRLVERPLSPLRWLAPALGLACGVAPALVLRMLRL